MNSSQKLAERDPEYGEFVEKFYEERQREFQERLQERYAIKDECEELAEQRVHGFKDKAPSKRRESVLDKMCARISALEAENEDFRDIARRFNYVVSYLSQNEPEILERIVVAFGHDKKHRNMFMNPYEYVPPFLAEANRMNRETGFKMLADEVERLEHEEQFRSDKKIDDSAESPAEDGTDDFDYDSEYGWLSPTGKFYPVEWSQHSIWSENKAIELGYATREDFRSGGDEDVLSKLHYGNEVMIDHGWCLIHEPLHGVPQYHVRVNGLTKKQREYLFDMYMRIGCEDKAGALYQS